MKDIIDKIISEVTGMSLEFIQSDDYVKVFDTITYEECFEIAAKVFEMKK